MDAALDLPFGWFGKHPAFGDFVSRGVPEPVREQFQDWLDGALGHWSDALGEGWRDAFDAAPVVRFWLGAQVLGTGWAGVLAPSRDKVGRRYPVVLLTAGGPLPPPLDPGQGVHDALGRHADRLLQDPDGAAGQEAPAETGERSVPDTLWASNRTAAVEDLLGDIAAEELTRAAQARSYWWTLPGPTRAARVISVTGLPDSAALGWLLSGAPEDVQEPQKEPQAMEAQGNP